MDTLTAYIPIDRRWALAQGRALPTRAVGSALLADISGFAPLANALVQALGRRRAAEELADQLNQVYTALIAPVHRYGGSVVGFVGDAITCWFDDRENPVQSARRATACAQAMQAALAPLAGVEVTPGVTARLAIKVGIAAGPARRFCVGDPQIRYLDTLAGETLRRMSQAEGLARPGEVLLGAHALAQAGGAVAVREERIHPRTGERFGVVEALRSPVSATPWPEPALDEAQARGWVLPAVCERLRAEHHPFQTGLRPAVALFVRFSGLDYDGDDAAGTKLDAYIRRVQAVVSRNGGALIQLTIGDKGSFFYAAFGAPVAHDDDAVRAVQAALELLEVPTDLAFITRTQIGLAAGQMRTGPYGSPARQTYGVIGDAAVLATRLMEAVPPGEIWCSPDVYHQARERIGFENLPPVRVKGRAGPVPVFRPRRGGAVPGVELPALVGRQAQVAWWREALEALAAGEPCLLVIEGEAGIGKSRLAAELTRLARERDLTCLPGAGQSIEQQTPYRAWRDLLSALFNLHTQADPAERRRWVTAGVERLLPGHDWRTPLLNDLLHLGLPDNELTRTLDPTLRQQSLSRLLIDLLRAAASPPPAGGKERGGLVVVLEDAHWLDSLSWGLAEQVARSLLASPAPLALLLVTRPPDEGSPGRESLSRLQALDGCHTWTLTGLGPDEIVALAAGRLGVRPGDLPPTLAGLVHERAGGNPFFAQEFILALRDRGLIHTSTAGEALALSISGDLDAARHTLPDTLHSLVLARMDRLPPERQFILKVATVIGRAFAYTPLHHTLRQYTDILERALLDHLAQLNAADFTQLEALEPDLTYLFKHVIVQEAAYRTLLFSQRRQLHRSVAGWYESTFGRADPDSPIPTSLIPYFPLLVHHYHHAEEWDRERCYARLAGELAAARYANPEAVRFLSRALDLTPDDEPAGRYGLLLSRERVYHLQGARQPQELDLAALEALVEALADGPARTQVALRRASYAEAIADYPAAAASAQRAIDLAEAAYDTEGEASGHLALGRVLFHQAGHETSQAHLEQALALARSAGFRQLEADSLRHLGRVSLSRGDYARVGGQPEHTADHYRQAQGYWEQALGHYREIGDRRGEGATLNNLGIVCEIQENYPSAIAYYEQALRTHRDIGARQGEGKTLHNLALVFSSLGDYAQTRVCGEQALAIRREVGDRKGESYTLGTLCLACLALGDHAAARVYSQQSLLLARSLGFRILESGALRFLGGALEGLGQPAEAAAAYHDAVAISRELGRDYLALEPLAGLARIALVQGDLARALAHIEKVLADLDAEHSLATIPGHAAMALTCYRVLRAAGDPRAWAVLSSAYRLVQEQAAKAPDAALRRAFLHDVPVYRELVATYQAMRAEEAGER